MSEKSNRKARAQSPNAALVPNASPSPSLSLATHRDEDPDEREWAEMSGNGEDSRISTLTFRQQSALPAIALAPTLSQAARDSGVGLSTLRRWLQEPEFRQQLANLRQESADLARQQAQAILPRCLSVFAEVMEAPDPSYVSAPPAMPWPSPSRSPSSRI